MKKQLDISAMENELRQGSAFFPKPSTPIQSEEKQSSPPPSRQSKTKVTKRHHRQHPKAKIKTSERSELRPVVSTLPLRRGTKRYSFEFYVDQLERLRRIKAEEGLKGRNLNVSEIVRIALDEYLEKIGL